MVHVPHWIWCQVTMRRGRLLLVGPLSLPVVWPGSGDELRVPLAERPQEARWGQVAGDKVRVPLGERLREVRWGQVAGPLGPAEAAWAGT